MGNRHTRTQRERWAHLTKSVSIDEVAAGAGVKRATVLYWRTEFGVGGGEIAVHSIDGRLRLGRDQTGSGTDAQPTDASAVPDECDMEAEVRQATSR